MKTTIDIPEALVREAKALARRQDATLRDLVVAGLRAEVARRSDTVPVDFAFPTVAGQGLALDLDPASVVHASYGLPT